MRSQKKNAIFKSYASVSLNGIQDDCRRTQHPQIYQASYKPLLLQLSINFGNKSRPTDTNNINYIQNETNAQNMSIKSRIHLKEGNKSICSQRYKINGVARPMTSKTGKSQKTANSELFQKNYSAFCQTFNGQNLEITKFLQKLYIAKTLDLKIYPNQKQQKIFISKMLKGLSKNELVAIQTDFGEKSVLVLSNYLKTHPIHKLVLDKNPIGDKSVIVLASLICKLPIKQISLVSVNMSNKSSKVLIKSIIGHKTLQQFNISSAQGINRNRINEQGFTNLKQALQNPLCCLTVLNLSNTCMGATGFLMFCSGFQSNPKLCFKIINLSSNQIFIAEQKQGYIRQCVSKISVAKLELQNNCLSDNGIKVLAIVVGMQYGRSNISLSLQYLDISNNRFRSFGFQALCNMMPNNKKLTQLYLNNNNLKQKEIFYCINTMMSKNWVLKKICLKNTLPACSGNASHHLKNLAQGLYFNRSVRELDLSENNISIEAAGQIFDALQKNQTLRILKLQSCGIDDACIFKISKMLKMNKGLTSINLSDNSITDKGAQQFLKILLEAHGIIQLNLSKNCISFHLLNQLKYRINQNKSACQYEQDPEQRYLKQSKDLCTKQKEYIQKAINQIQKKTKCINARQLAIDIVEKQEQISKKQNEIRKQTLAIAKLKQQLNISEIEQNGLKNKLIANQSSHNSHLQQSKLLITDINQIV